METRETYIVRCELAKCPEHWSRVAEKAATVEELADLLRREVSEPLLCIGQGCARSLLEDALDGVHWLKLARELKG